MSTPTVIGVGALIHSATLGMIAIAAPTRGEGLLLVDARVCIDGRGARSLTAILRNAGASPIGTRDVDLLLLDRHGHLLDRLRATTTALAAAACCRVHARIDAAAAARFRVQLTSTPQAAAHRTPALGRCPV